MSYTPDSYLTMDIFRLRRDIAIFCTIKYLNLCITA